MLQERVWSPHGPKGLAARGVFMLLIWHADATGRTWLGIQTIANKVGAGSLRTVRNALDALVRDGWLRSTPQTWATLTAEQSAVGRPVPRRGDVGQAPNLYILLDGRGKPVTSDAQPLHPGFVAKDAEDDPKSRVFNVLPRPGLARATTPVANTHEPTPSPEPFDQGIPVQMIQGSPLADLHVDPDPKGSPSRIESVERASRVEESTHISVNIHERNDGWSEPWKVIVEAHADKTKAVYGLRPLPPDLKREQQQALAECLDGAALEVRTKLRERTGTERAVADVRSELAGRVMQLYFKRDVEHLRRVKHALRDLPREFHARITEAMQAFLREHHEAMQPHRPPVEHKSVETNKPIERPEPRDVQAAQMITAREARRLLGVLSAAPTRDEIPTRPAPEHELPLRRSNVNVKIGPDRQEQPKEDKREGVPPIPLCSNDAPAARIAHTELRCPYENQPMRTNVSAFAHAADGERGFVTSMQTNQMIVCRSQI